MSESQKPNNVIQFPQQTAETQSADTSVNRKHFWDHLTRRGKVVAATGALAAVSTVVAATGPDVPTDRGPAVHDIKIGEDKSVIDLGIENDTEEKLVSYTVKQGDSVTEIVSKVYGADDGENIMNNEFYAEEVAAIEGNIPEGQLLQPGQVLELPADIIQHAE